MPPPTPDPHRGAARPLGPAKGAPWNVAEIDALVVGYADQEDPSTRCQLVAAGGALNLTGPPIA